MQVIVDVELKDGWWIDWFSGLLLSSQRNQRIFWLLSYFETTFSSGQRSLAWLT
jgi:hypothetical protein